MKTDGRSGNGYRAPPADGTKIWDSEFGTFLQYRPNWLISILRSGGHIGLWVRSHPTILWKHGNRNSQQWHSFLIRESIRHYGYFGYKGFFLFFSNCPSMSKRHRTPLMTIFFCSVSFSNSSRSYSHSIQCNFPDHTHTWYDMIWYDYYIIRHIDPIWCGYRKICIAPVVPGHTIATESAVIDKTSNPIWRCSIVCAQHKGWNTTFDSQRTIPILEYERMKQTI